MAAQDKRQGQNQQNQPPRQELQVILNTVKAKDYQEMIRKSLKDQKMLDAFTEATLAALRSNPGAFLDCEKTSLYNVILEAARRGICPDGKQGALVPYRVNIGSKEQPRWVKKAQFLIMPQGIIDAFSKVGIVAYAQSVYENDEIRFWSDDTGQHVEHRYNPFLDRGDRIGSYAAGVTRGGRCYVEAMSMDELRRARDASKTPDKGPWVDWPERMEQKSALHRLDKRMPGAGVSGDEEVEPDYGVQVANSDPPATGDAHPNSGSGQKSPAALSDESHRPRGLQSIIDEEASMERVEAGTTGSDEAHGHIEQGDSPF